MPVRLCISIIYSTLAAALAATGVQAADVVSWDTRQQGGFIVALSRDHAGAFWVGTEDDGLWRVPDVATPRGRQHFTDENGLGDNTVAALACDHQGNIWAGHRNHGVSVFNGSAWKTYDVSSGPLGEHVTCIAVEPRTGDVWVGTEAGIACYSPTRRDWTYITRANGLTSDQITAIAFDGSGDAFVGTDCDGLCIATSTDVHGKWRSVRSVGDPLIMPRGEGLPTDLINSICVTRDDTVYVGTTHGLAWSRNRGNNWSYVRGSDWLEMLKGRCSPPTILPKDEAGGLLFEDYVTTLAADNGNRVWIGHRKAGYEIRASKTLFLQAGDSTPDRYVRALLPLANGTGIVGLYGLGCTSAVTQAADDYAPVHNADAPDGRSGGPLPVPAKSLSVAQLEALCGTLSVPAVDIKSGDGVYFGEDWVTQGDWVGRYGLQEALLCAVGVPLDHEYHWNLEYKVTGTLGPHHTEDDGLRNWTHWAKTTNPKSLYCLSTGRRTQGEWDDHGEAYPMTFEGPDLWATVRVDRGVHLLSLYFMNKDGHDGANRYRDYLIELHRGDPSRGADGPVVAQARTHGFWGGVYKTFLIAGPSYYRVHIAKNGSLNTIVSAIMVDKIKGARDEWDDNIPFLADLPYGPPRYQAPSSPTARAAEALWQAALGIRYQPVLLNSWRLTACQAYRAALTTAEGGAMVRNWRWFIHEWSAQERAEFTRTMAEGWARWRLTLMPPK